MHLGNDADVGELVLGGLEKFFFDELESLDIDAEWIAQGLKDKGDARINAFDELDHPLDFLRESFGGDDDFGKDFFLHSDFEKRLMLFFKRAVAGARGRLEIHRDDVTPAEDLF